MEKIFEFNLKILFFRFDEDLEAIYAELFAPMCITRQQFQKLCSVKVLGTYPKVLNFHSGECYSIQDMTKTDRLALCLRGSRSFYPAMFSLIPYLAWGGDTFNLLFNFLFSSTLEWRLYKVKNI